MEHNIQQQLEDILTPDKIPQPKEILAFICEHLNGALFAVDPTKLVQEIYKSGGFIIDVRNPVDYLSGGRLHNSTNVPESKLIHWVRDHKDITENTAILVYSNSGNLAQTALRDLNDYGYKNVTNIGTHKWYPMCS